MKRKGSCVRQWITEEYICEYTRRDNNIATSAQKVFPVLDSNTTMTTLIILLLYLAHKNFYSITSPEYRPNSARRRYRTTTQFKSKTPLFLFIFIKK